LALATVIGASIVVAPKANLANLPAHRAAPLFVKSRSRIMIA